MSKVQPVESTAAGNALADAERLLAIRDLEEALRAFWHAQTLGGDPDRCSAGRWQCYMLQGLFESAWQENDAIRARGAPNSHRWWDGGALTGKRVVVRNLHGMGDTLQLLRYLPMLNQTAARVIVEVAPAMKDLTRCITGATGVSTWQDPPQHWDSQIEVMELPYIFRTVLDDIPNKFPYLVLPDVVSPMSEIKHRGAPFQVGIAWKAGTWNPSRSIPFDLLRPLLQIRPVTFWNLLPERSGGSMLESEDAGKGLVAVASLIAGLDLVISVDTLAAHLAGAMGKPVWLLLQKYADWRWMTNRADTPWYPGTRVFRQQQQGNWREVISQVEEGLEQWTQCL